MSGGNWSGKAHALLLNAMQKQAWGESLDYFDPGDLVELLGPAISDAIEAVDDRGTIASILLDLYRTYGVSDQGAVSMLWRASPWTESGALRAACEAAVQRAGPEVIELLRETLTDEADEEAVVDFLFDMCRVAVEAITDPTAKLEMLRTACDQALDATDDPTIAKSLRDGFEVAVQPDGRSTAKALLDYYQNEAALETGDPWLLLEALIETLCATPGLACSEEATMYVLMKTLREAIAGGGAEQLWEDYQDLLIERCEFEGPESAEALLEAYKRVVHAVTDPKWIADQVLEVCDDIACADDDSSFWLPDRVQVSRACMDMIEAVGGPRATRNAISLAFEFAVHGTSNPWDVLTMAFQEVERRASDDSRQRIADVVIRASQRAMSDVLSSALESVHSSIRHPERIVDLLQQAAEGERAFWAFRKAQNTRGAERARAVEWLLAALSERQSKDDSAPTIGAPPVPPLFRAFRLAATALDDPTITANLLAVILMATQRRERGIDIEHAIGALAESIAALGDPASEATVMYNAFIEAIWDGNDPTPAVQALLDATEEAIEKADDPAGAVAVLLNGLYVQPTGWPPPIPAWLRPE